MGGWSRRKLNAVLLTILWVVVVMAMAMVGVAEGRRSHNTSCPSSSSSSSKSNDRGHNHGSKSSPCSSSKGIKKGRSGDKGGYNYPISNIFDVLSFGAQGDGLTDDTKAFATTWQKACQVKGAVVEVPAYFIFLVGPLMFSGPCQNNIVFQIDGKIVPSSNVDSWSSSNLSQWIGFSKVHSLVLQGQGLLDGKGDSWWSLSCNAKSSGGRRRHKLCDSPTAIQFNGSYNITVRDLTIINSPQTHLKFNNCRNVQVNNISISSPYNSPNTDGIHLQNSNIVKIRNSFIQSGDDCISIQSGTSNIEIHDVYCGHGHGIGIGGLGKGRAHACVSNISVHDVFIKDSLNGVRINTWQGGSGGAKRINFSNIRVQNTSNPIVIDQYYCDAHSCHNQSSAVHVSEVNYNNITGTYRHGRPFRLECSDSIPCTSITLSKIQLVSITNASATNHGGPLCWNAYGYTKTSTIPPITCLKRGSPKSRSGKPLLNGDDC